MGCRALLSLLLAAPLRALAFDAALVSSVEHRLASLFPAFRGAPPKTLDVPSYRARLHTGREFQGVSKGSVVSASSLDGTKTYGEFPIESFAMGLEEALAGAPRKSVFLDVGAGVGRIAMAASMLHPFDRSVGIELSEDLYDMSLRIRAVAEGEEGMEAIRACELVQGDIFGEDGLQLLREADVIFCYSTTWPAVGDMLTSLTEIVALHCRPGTMVITTDKKLGDGMDLGKPISMYAEVPRVKNPETGDSTLFVHRREE